MSDLQNSYGMTSWKPRRLTPEIGLPEEGTARIERSKGCLSSTDRTRSLPHFWGPWQSRVDGHTNRKS